MLIGELVLFLKIDIVPCTKSRSQGARQILTLSSFNVVSLIVTEMECLKFFLFLNS